MILKQLIRYENAPALEATWVEIITLPQQEIEPGVVDMVLRKQELVVKCQAYSNHPEQMAMLRADLGADAAQYEGMIAEVEATYAPPEPEPIGVRQAAAWERIKAERDRRKYLGVKAGAHWFHSDDASRIQQLALVMMGANIPAGLQWKTLTLTPPPVFVEMTPALASGIFQATAAIDQAIFAAAEAHRIAMEASPTPEDYDFSAGWPATIYDEAA